MQKTRFYTIDLTKTRGSGEFRCPRCGTEMSPEDRTEEVYTILEPVMKGDALESLVLKCNKCGCHIRLIGFNLLH